MEYKGFTVAVTLSYQGSSIVGAPIYTIPPGGAVVHENAIQEKFADEIAAEDAAFSEAREWIDAKCQAQLAETVPRSEVRSFFAKTRDARSIYCSWTDEDPLREMFFCKRSSRRLVPLLD